MNTVYDVAVIGAGPAGSQAAVSASHQMRHVLVLDAGAVSNRRGRAYWSKSVPIEDAPALLPVIGPKLDRALKEWLISRPVREMTVSGETRKVGIDLQGGMALALEKKKGLFEITASVKPLGKNADLDIRRFTSRTVVVASGFEDRWPNIEVNGSRTRWLEKYRIVFRYAGNRHGWHICIRCDGHLHVDKPFAILGVGDGIYDAALGAQDFTDRLTILTNGRPHGMSDTVLAQARERGIVIDERKIQAHIGKGTDLLGVRFEDGGESFFDGFLVDEGLEPNTQFLRGWDVRTDEEGLLVVDEDGQVLGAEGNPVPGLFAAGDLVSGTRNLIATAFASGQNAGLSASDALRRWQSPAADVPSVPARDRMGLHADVSP